MTPKGFRDVLPEEAEEREALAGSLAGAFRSWGYRPVQTPVVEERETFESAAGAALTRESFTMVDTDGSLLVLRPEMTVPIARVAASRMASQEPPFRLMYVADVFREQPSLRGQAREFAQAGVELLGPGGPEADAEVVTVLAESLRSCGLKSFSVVIGTVEVVRSLIDKAGMDDAWGRALMEAAHARNLVEVRGLARRDGVPAAVSFALDAVFRMRGGAEAIAACREALAPAGCGAALDRVTAVWELLSATGSAPEVSVDLGLLRSFDYYTGLIMEAYTPGLGMALGGGGRYDGVMAALGRPMPAAGFALGLERLHIAASEQGAPLRGCRVDAVVGGVDAGAVYVEAARLRSTGLSAEVLQDVTREELARRARARGDCRALWVDGGPAEEVGS